MSRKFKLFVQKNLFQNWQFRFLHLFSVAGIFLFCLLDFQSQLNSSLVTSFFGVKNFTTSLDVPVFLLSLGIYSLIFFNLNLLIRSPKWDILFLFFSLFFINLLGFFNVIYNNQSWPFFQANLFLMIEANISSLCRIAVLENENNLVQNAFGKYVNKDLLEEIVAKPKKFNLDSQEKHMTVLFSDIRGFTTLAEKLAAKKLVSLLNLYLEEMSLLVAANNGTIDKFIGDAVMAFWNAPIDDKNQATNAVLTAISMVHKLHQLKLKNPIFKVLNIGVGVNTGQMVVGNIGSRSRFNYTIIGDNVNLGARLEGLTKKYGLQILISQNTVKDCLDLKKHKIIFRLIDEIIVKGKTKPIKIFQPLHENKHNGHLKHSYEIAFKMYQVGQFKEAFNIFSSLAASGDPVSKTLLARLKTLKPGVAWNGVWNWDEK